ncbi:hypothetical protein HQ447_02370 [bacterium]|nr:hypothetical protein [bacterium]
MFFEKFGSFQFVNELVQFSGINSRVESGGVGTHLKGSRGLILLNSKAPAQRIVHDLLERLLSERRFHSKAFRNFRIQCQGGSHEEHQASHQIDVKTSTERHGPAAAGGVS